MQRIYFSTQESGPDEDHQTQSPKSHKILDEEDLSVALKEGIYKVEKDKQQIEEFIDSVPTLVRHGGTFGLIWNKSLQPSDGRYEPGEHFCRTREMERNSANGCVSFYRDGETGQKFAIKTLQDSDHFHPCEIKISLVCNSPHLCAVYGVIVKNHKVHFLLEHAGLELIKERSWIAECPERILKFAKQSFQALEDLHGYGYVHCDIKPDNVMIVRDQGEDFTVKIIDFGSCQPKGEVLPPDAHTTRFYWSPEIWQALNSGDQVICQPAMDVYALALTLYFVQTASHLMNMLQERDILPLMTQRSEDLLLIALPETIPSGLRAVMRPCLAGKAEERWSAQQAANQLDGDAMMQKALSNPRGENYKDLFQQLLRNQFEKRTFQSSEVFPPQNPKMTWTDQNSSCIKNENHKTYENQSPVHYFVANNKGTDKRDMGYHMKPAGVKAATDKKQSAPVRVKKSGTTNIGKFPKTKKVIFKGQFPPKHLKQMCEPNKVAPHTTAHNDQEVHYISSDETMPLNQGSSKQELNQEPTKKNVTCTEESDRSIVNNSDEKCKKETACVHEACGQDIQSKESHQVLHLKATENLEPKTAKPTPIVPLDTDTQAFSCSALLITLASQARSSNECLPFGHTTLPLPSSHSITGQLFERDKSYNPVSFHSNKNTSDISLCHTIASCRLQAKSNEVPHISSHIQKAQAHAHNATIGEKQSTIAKLENEKVNVAEAQAPASHQSMSIKQSQAHEEKEDEMEFVYEALEVPQFTGRAEDILDSLCNMLDKDESKSVPDASARNVKEQKLTEPVDQEEPMEVSDGSRERHKAHPNASLSYQKEKNRKRISVDTESNIPTKVHVGHDQSNDPSTDHLLPVFDKILSENMS
ncbi:CMGC family protein kinase [Elysia marginata]|uniref:CMGC family protein kinase n=1 Tax=Elysia marginata TaxID=1093978 RepID=A0AAV4JPH4_9GAST|nr:CMGC family protein kinase [Elysia marginata]